MGKPSQGPAGGAAALLPHKKAAKKRPPPPREAPDAGPSSSDEEEEEEEEEGLDARRRAPAAAGRKRARGDADDAGPSAPADASRGPRAGTAPGGAGGARSAGAAGAAGAVVAAGRGAEGPAFHNKEKVLVLCSVGATARHRHLMLDLLQLLPHAKKETKLDAKGDQRVLNELADLRGCSSVLYMETRKRQDLYLWLAKAPVGPSVKFLVSNVHTMAELKLAGNHLKGSRPLLCFAAGFEELPHLRVLKEIFIQLFGTPAGHRKMKPFVDHVLSFSLLDGRVWLRNYQVAVPERPKGPGDLALVEVGPRLCLTPIKMFAGSFGGATLYDNPSYITPNAARSDARRAKAGKYKNKLRQRRRREEHEDGIGRQVDELEGTFD